MNFVGHIHLAQRYLHNVNPSGGDAGDGRRGDSYDNVGFLLGAALPDFAAMGRFRITERPADPAVRSGIELHHRTDDAFHAHPWFRHLSKSVSTKLEDAGIGRGAARACGHVGVELLLDGMLLEETAELRDAVERATARSIDQSLGLATAVDIDHRSDWEAHLDSVATWPLPSNYRNPGAVSERLRRILTRRPRLAFDVAHVSIVAMTLAEYQSELEAGAPRLLAELDLSLAA